MDMGIPVMAFGEMNSGRKARRGDHIQTYSMRFRVHKRTHELFDFRFWYAMSIG